MMEDAAGSIDLCTGGAPFTNAASYVGGHPEYAFDDNPNTGWYSGITGEANSGAAFIGYAFGQPRQIHKVGIRFWYDTAGSISSVTIQRSNDQTAWTTVATASISIAPNTWTYVTF